VFDVEKRRHVATAFFSISVVHMTLLNEHKNDFAENISSSLSRVVDSCLGEYSVDCNHLSLRCWSWDTSFRQGCC
jgi:hypothetical protein